MPLSLPPELLSTLEPDTDRDLAVVVSTIDSAGYPHFSLLSAFEVFHSGGTLFCNLRITTTAAANLIDRNRGALAFLQRSGAYYLKFEADHILDLDECRIFSLSIASVKVDRPAGDESGAGLAGELTFQEGTASRERRRLIRRKVTEALSRKIGGF